MSFPQRSVMSKYLQKEAQNNGDDINFHLEDLPVIKA
jgi:hypothetical protein